VVLGSAGKSRCRNQASRYDHGMIDGTRSSEVPPSVRIRKATPEEIPRLTPIDLSANPVFAEWGHPEFTSEYESLPDDLALEAIAEGRLLVCDVANPDESYEMVGWVVMFDRPNGETSIGQISVHADHMGNGYGGPLLLASIDRCRRLARKAVVLNTQTDVPWNRPWYERFGFVVVPRSEWDLDMHETEREQTEAGLDWSTRVHMRLALS
jgi:GNAT superfamily N-acetyltransferase